MRKDGHDGASIGNYFAGTSAQCSPCKDGSHGNCENRRDLSLRGNGFMCQCSCTESNTVSDHGLKTLILGAGGRSVGIRTGDGREFMYGPREVGL